MQNRRWITVFGTSKITAASKFSSDLLVLFPKLQTADWFIRNPLDEAVRHMILIIECESHNGMHKLLPVFAQMPEYIQDRKGAQNVSDIPYFSLFGRDTA